MTKKPVLTERQKKVLELMEHFIQEYGYPPNDREICNMANIASASTVRYILRQLEEMGYIEMDTHVGRGLRMLKTAEQVPVSLKLSEYFGKQGKSEILEVPLIGRILASTPIPFPVEDGQGEEEADRDELRPRVAVPRGWLPENLELSAAARLFAFEVRGDSLVDALVSDGDIVILQPAKAAHNGDFVAVWLKNKSKTALRYYYNETGRERLQPANPSLGPTHFDSPGEVEIQARVVAVLRSSFNGLGAAELLPTLTFHISGGSKLTPSYLVEGVLPYIKAVAEVQEMILQIQGEQPQEVMIRSISQQAPSFRISFEGAREAIEVIQRWIAPWRRSQVESMARIQERKAGIEIALAEAEMRAEELMRAKEKSEYEKLASEIDLKRQVAKKMQAENEQAEMNLQNERLALAPKVLAAYGPWLSDDELNKLVPRLLSPLILLSSVQIEVG